METNCPIESLERALVFSPHDWGSHHRLAWIYGIVVGWDDDALEEFQAKFKWTDETVQRLKELHEKTNKLREESK